MSLAMCAALIDDNSNITLLNNYNNNENILNQKRHKRTQRKYPKIENFDTQKVNSVLEKIHNMSDDDEDDNNKESFYPPPNPESAGVQRTIPNKVNENFGGMDNSFIKTMGKEPSPSSNYQESGMDNLDLNKYSNYGDDKTIEAYYKNILPGYEKQKHLLNINNPQNNPQNNKNSYEKTQDLLLQKLNYMITLLEGQQDEKTNNVAEEVILYSFLGIFIIFIADTFVRVGKYTR